MACGLLRGRKRRVVAKESEGKEREKRDFATHSFLISLRNKFTLLDSDELDNMSKLLSP